MKHRFVRRVSALALAGCLLAGSSLPAFAAASAAKEEVIYANLTASGAVTGVYAVNSFSVQAGDTVADHGSYTAVRNMTTSDAVEQSGDTVTVHVTEDGKLYYEGTMDAATALPWVVKLTYTLDGAEISPDELGGKSGALSIRLQVSRNPDCTGSFFDDYALQVTMSLDTEPCPEHQRTGRYGGECGQQKAALLHPAAGRGQRRDRHRRCDGLCHGRRFPERCAAEPEPRPRGYGPDRDAGTAAERFRSAGRWGQRAGRRHCAGAGGHRHPERQFCRL